MPPSSSTQDLDDLRTRASSSLAAGSNQRVRKAWVIKNLLLLLEPPADEIGPKAAELIALLVTEKNIKTLNASTARVSEIIVLFGLEVNEVPWKTTEEVHPVPELLTQCLANFKAAFYGDNSEATCRIAVDYMVVAAKLRLNELHPPAPSRFKKRKLHLPAPSPPPHLPIRVFPELELDVLVTTEHSQSRVTGRADWALGYGARSTKLSGAVLVAVEAKRLEKFSQAEAQLLTCLAILRQLRLHSRKVDPVVQGFFSDGTQYKFVGVSNEGEVYTSRTYDTWDKADMKTVFNFIVTVLDTATKSSPCTPPVKEGAREVAEFAEGVWVKVYNTGGGGLEVFEEEEGEVLCEMPEMVLGVGAKREGL